MGLFFYSIFHVLGDTFLWMCGLFAAFAILQKLMPCNPGQPLWRKDSPTDLAYGFILPILTRFVRIAFIGIGVFFLFRGQSHQTISDYLTHGYGPLHALPVWSQAAVIFLVSDVVLYGTHRWFHGETMWRFHAIHHSSQQVDWLSTYRFHPINIWLSFTLLDAVTLLVGFSPEAVGLMSGFNTIYSAMVHANLNWSFGPFKYIFASPVFHRWHHTAQEEGMNKNFAPTFPLLDLAFGTFYMPENRLPQHYGVPGSDINDSFIGQMVWPLRPKANRLHSM